LDPDLKEVVDAYMLKVPCVRVFRRGVMGDYRGPALEPTETESVASYLKQDSLVTN